MEKNYLWFYQATYAANTTYSSDNIQTSGYAVSRAGEAATVIEQLLDELGVGFYITNLNLVAETYLDLR